MTSIEEQIAQAVKDPELPNYYFNGFSVSGGNADVVFILKVQDRPVAVLRTTYEVAKTLVIKTEPIIHKIEKTIGQTFKTTDEIGEKMLANLAKETEENPSGDKHD